MTKKTIFIGCSDVASIYKDFRRSFESLGYKVLTYADFPSNSQIIQKDKYDYILNDYLPSFLKFNKNEKLNKLKKYLLYFIRGFFAKNILKEVINEVDIFLFKFNSMYFTSNDLKYIKKHNKKIVFVFCGDDARWYYGMKQEFEMLGLEPVEYGKEYLYNALGLYLRLNKIRKAEKYADFLFSKREQAQIQIRPFYHYPMLVNPNDYTIKEKNNTKVKIVHAPSHTSIKGSSFILKAIDELKQEGLEFEFELLQNKNHKELVKMLSETDILIDQLFLPGGGKLSTEALASGCLVMTNMSYEIYNQGIDLSECPIVDVNKSNIKENLREFILDNEKRKSISNRGKDFVEKFLDVDIFTKIIDSLLIGTKIEFTYKPDFFTTYFVPESIPAKLMYNHYNKLVRNEDWYYSDKYTNTNMDW